MNWDVIVVGGRCSGAPTAMLLARQGHKVLVVDKATFPSDVPYSTHLLHVRGSAYLKKWGLLDRLAQSGCPPMRKMLLDFGAVTITGGPPPVEGVADTYAPRRFIFDKILVDAAREAGVEIREGFSVDEILMEGTTVVGIKGKDASGKVVEERARVVVGADGTQSKVAQAVGAKKYNTREPKVMTYFAYWSGVSIEPGFDLEFHPRVGLCSYAWPTHNNQVLIGANWLVSELPRIKQNPEAHYMDVLKKCSPRLAERVAAGKRETEFVGGATENFLRESAGPGWALVGDAGANYEFASGQGITNGFRAADLLAAALHDGLSGQRPMPEALAQYQKDRDAGDVPYYDFTYKQMTLGSAPPTKIFQAIAASPEWSSMFLGVIAEAVAPSTFFGPGNMLKILFASVFGAKKKAA
jgi:flavin-dependent dehydrogenase